MILENDITINFENAGWQENLSEKQEVSKWANGSKWVSKSREGLRQGTSQNDGGKWR